MPKAAGPAIVDDRRMAELPPLQDLLGQLARAMLCLEAGPLQDSFLRGRAQHPMAVGARVRRTPRPLSCAT